MSQKFIEKTGPLAVGLAGMAVGVPGAGFKTAMAAPGALSLLWRNDPQRIATRAITGVLDGLRQSPDLARMT